VLSVFEHGIVTTPVLFSLKEFPKMCKEFGKSLHNSHGLNQMQVTDGKTDEQ